MAAIIPAPIALMPKRNMVFSSRASARLFRSTKDETMTLSGFLAYSGALAIAAAIPGPQIVAIVAQAMKSGYRQAIWMTLGMVVGDVLYLTAVLAGLAYIAESFTLALIVIKWAGVAYLLWLAYQYWTADFDIETEGTEAQAGSHWRVLASGALVTFGNPKSILFYIAILPTIIDLNAVTLTDVFALVALTATILTLAQLPFVLAGAKARHALKSPRAMRLMNRGAAVLMGGAAATIAARQ